MKSGPSWLLPILLLLPLAEAAAFSIKEVQIKQADSEYRLNARIEYHLSEQAHEALSNGVPLTLKVQLFVEKVWRGFWEPSPFAATLSFQIRYHALTELYRVVDRQTGDEQNFVTQEAALHALGEITNLPLVKLAKLTAGETYQLRLRADLDIESLPLPLQPLAYLGRGWKLTTGWSQWPLQP
ncbi:MAG: DUF4390 domain-containing protein [gamma proteobacterium symbiont of Ctena orbiculata]|nr:DUF4390 domain-containing protein [Candidatus Thiodiazotropha taylori]MBT3060367.1 DUF4390 domain-containing protein [Candidatus Thiodiazotropha sp. (ex Lucina pensylvanica)]MBT3064756.1 DUF4390 domain-containing protein [Candidatus Thiodiazotropha sp. (ex Lucina pensylvanica)]MBV2095406.1 DUF4390 domain-containing protein [Candidatus Thiodiazotropha sp. (ex Codakia orbicularis)]PUB79554.1 MAG: DUF4390 domain-containing protein [gamma proteobacterium symbiont of Ctena orbiculata]